MVFCCCPTIRPLVGFLICEGEGSFLDRNGMSFLEFLSVHVGPNFGSFIKSIYRPSRRQMALVTQAGSFSFSERAPTFTL